MLIVTTDWSDKFNDGKIDEDTYVKDLLGFDKGAAKWMINKRIKAFGCDMESPDSYEVQFSDL
ncbi:MAG TPA: hypothetical protein ENI49_01940 [Thermoplasmatales archaeon]|nr:hypothetical protein [Thermoplasmatales archaeon]